MSVSMALLPLVERAARRALNRSGLQSRIVRTSIADQHLYDARGEGSLPTIVVLHGINSAATAFAPVIQRLRPHARRILAPDAPGHGFSGGPFEPLTPDSLFASTRELLDAELDEPAILYGNSLGGAVALNYALERPERVRGLFLSSPAGAAMSEEALRAFMKTFDVRSRAETTAFIDRLYHKTPWFTALITGDVQQSFARDAILSFTSSTRVEHLLQKEQLATLKVPIHLVWGRSERLLPRESLDFFKDSLPPHATFDEPEGFGHCPHLDEPARIARDIVAFARRVAGP
jgi:pimeloyl-ACP methyl ester carboxylesterase